MLDATWCETERRRNQRESRSLYQLSIPYCFLGPPINGYFVDMSVEGGKEKEKREVRGKHAIVSALISGESDVRVPCSTVVLAALFLEDDPKEWSEVDVASSRDEVAKMALHAGQLEGEMHDVIRVDSVLDAEREGVEIWKVRRNVKDVLHRVPCVSNINVQLEDGLEVGGDDRTV